MSEKDSNIALVFIDKPNGKVDEKLKCCVALLSESNEVVGSLMTDIDLATYEEMKLGLRTLGSAQNLSDSQYELLMKESTIHMEMDVYFVYMHEVVETGNDSLIVVDIELTHKPRVCPEITKAIRSVKAPT